MVQYSNKSKCLPLIPRDTLELKYYSLLRTLKTLTLSTASSQHIYNSYISNVDLIHSITTIRLQF